MERIAIIDLGSNSIRFIIMQIGEHGAYKLIYQEKKRNLSAWRRG